ncbi:hypothetical protein NMY22_g14085 [Coprinellus aureogranulatus]|nr:hypothetical protein NMY22_g14085 [Coprinellus aureogranulatus]
MSNAQEPHPTDSETVGGVAEDSAQTNERLRVMIMGGSGEPCQAHLANVAISKTLSDKVNTTSEEEKGEDTDSKTK